MTHLVRTARRLALIAILALVAVGTPACGDYHHHDDYYGGTLQVLNDPQSLWVVETVGVSVSGGPVELFDVFLAPGEDAFIDLYPDTYDVDLWWSDTTMETVPGVDIWDDEVTTVFAYNPNP